MRKLSIVVVLLLCLMLVGATSCNALGGEEEVVDQFVEVVRGDLMVTVSGSGNIEISDEMKLTFGVAGRIDKIYVEEGDIVNEGDVLAKLETGALELALTQAQVAYLEASATVSQALTAVTQAQLALQTAEYNLDKAEDTYEWPELEVAYADVEKAMLSVENIQDKLANAIENDPGGDHSSLYTLLARAEANLFTLQGKLDAMLSGDDKEEVAIKKLQVQVAQESLELAQQSLELAQHSPELAQQSLEQVQKQLNDATITAPFDGEVAKVYVDEKDTVSTATTIIHLIDPSRMELNIDVDEVDVAEVKPGQRAIIEVDALPDLLLEGEVGSINLLPEEEGGVIVFEVKINFDAPEGIGLRIGMSASADIVINERSNALLVPDRAIKQDSQGNTVVKVMVNEQIEERTVVTGISDGFETEIVDGLEEGEVVIGRQ